MVSQKDGELESLRRELEAASADGVALTTRHQHKMDSLARDLKKSNKELFSRQSELDSLRSAMAERERALTSTNATVDRLTSDLASCRDTIRQTESERDSHRAKAAQLQVPII